jgi:hypothetical protein
MSGNNEWSIQKHVVQDHPLGFKRNTFVVREGAARYAPGFCDECDGTMVLVDGAWDEGDCAKCNRGGCSISWPMDPKQLWEGVASAMFPRDYEAEEAEGYSTGINSVARGDPQAGESMPVGFIVSMRRDQGEEFARMCRLSDVTPQEAILGALVMSGLVKP